MVSLDIIFRTEKEGQGNVFRLRRKLDGIVSFVACRAAAALFEIQGTPENLLGIIIRAPFTSISAWVFFPT